MRVLKISVLIAAVCLFSLPAVAFSQNASSSDNSFSQGTKAFSQGSYKKALEHFQAARRAGMAGTALHYNLGVTYYKLQQYEKAREAFETLTKDPNSAPLAHYNLGMVALAQGQKSAARLQFQMASRKATDEKLRALADERLKELPRTPRLPEMSGFFSLSAGYDDNVTLNVDNEVLIGKVEDEFLEFIGAVTGQLTGTRDNGLQLKATGYYQDYMDADEFDFGNFRIGPEYDRVFGNWNTSLAAFVDLAYIDRESFERIFSMEASGSREIYPDVVLDLEYQLGVIDAQAPYENLTGNRHRFSVDLRSMILGAYTGIGYTLELNDRDDPDFPIRHSAGFRVDKDLTDTWSVGATGNIRYSDYQETSREDERLWLSARISREIPWDLRVFGKYDYIQNYSNVDANEYTSNLFFLGIERFF